MTTSPNWEIDPASWGATDGDPILTIDAGPFELVANTDAGYPNPLFADTATGGALHLRTVEGMWAALFQPDPEQHPRPEQFALAIVVTVGGDTLGWDSSFLSWSRVNVIATDTGFSTAGWNYPDLYLEGAAGRMSPRVVGLISDETSARLYIDGQLVDTTLPGEAESGTLRVQMSSGGRDLLLHQVQGWDDPPVDFEDIMAGLVATYLPATTLKASGAWDITGAGDLTVIGPEDPDPTWPPTPVEPEPGGAQEPPEDPEPQDPPLGTPRVRLRRYSEILPPPLIDAQGFPIDWTPNSVIDEEYGRFQIIVEGEDITYLFGIPTPMPVWSRREPFGSFEATISLPQVTAFHSLPSWCKAGANIIIRLKKIGEPNRRVFTGVLMSFGTREDDGVLTLECLGVVYAADLQLRQPEFRTAPADAGTVIADVLNSAVGRRYKKVPPVITKCSTSVMGAWEPRVTGFVQTLLSTMVRRGKQWTVKCEDRQPEIVLKDTTTVSWSFRFGQRGIHVDLVRDHSQAPNAIFGEGVSSSGGRWRNAMYPNWRPDDTPPYPFNNPNRLLNPGVRDEDTDTGNGVSLWQEKAGQPITGTITSDDRSRAVEIQRAGGILDNGVIGPQTWAVTFGTGSNSGTLECFFLPLAFVRRVMPRIYGPHGEDLGENPNFRPSVLRVEDKIDFGQGVSKKEGKRAAKEILARDSDPGWVGTITFTLDPREMSRYDIVEGSNGLIRGFRGENLRVHVVQVEYGEAVTVTVDTNARDFPRLDAVRERERNATDPAKLALHRVTGSKLGSDRATFDAESPAGHVPKHALFENLWTVIRVPFGDYGQIAKTVLRTTGPASSFSVAVFAKPVTAADMLGMVGNPLGASVESNPWDEAADELEAAGLLMAWGWRKQPGGYYPRTYTTPDTSPDTPAVPVTGRLVDDSSWEFASARPPWVWVAEIASQSCFIEGRFWPGVD